MAADRVFTLAGTGTIVTGSIRAGAVRVGDRVIVSPSGREARVRGLHAQNRPVETAGARREAAVNLAGIEREAIQRGDLLVAPEPSRADAALRCAREARRVGAQAASRLVGRASPCRSGGMDGAGRAARRGTDRAGATALAQIVPDRPIALFGGGDRSSCATPRPPRAPSAAAWCLDIRAPERGRREARAAAALKAIAERGPAGALPDLLALPPYAIDRGA